MANGASDMCWEQREAFSQLGMVEERVRQQKANVTPGSPRRRLAMRCLTLELPSARGEASKITGRIITRPVEALSAEDTSCCLSSAGSMLRSQPSPSSVRPRMPKCLLQVSKHFISWEHRAGDCAPSTGAGEDPLQGKGSGNI